jgi:hypothetical protein
LLKHYNMWKLLAYSPSFKTSLLSKLVIVMQSLSSIFYLSNLLLLPPNVDSSSKLLAIVQPTMDQVYNSK